MKKTILAGSAFILITGFVKTQPVGPTPSLFEKKWYVRKVNQIYGKDLPAFKTDTMEGQTAFLKFNKEKQSAGGNGGCNSFGGHFYIHKDSISITDIISTQQYCEGTHQVEEDLFAALRKINRFEITGNRLVLFDGKNNLLEFESE